MKTSSFLALLPFISMAMSSPVPSPYDVLQHQNNDDPTGTSTVLHHMVNAEDRVLHIVHPDGTTHSMTLMPSSGMHGGNVSGQEGHLTPHVATVHYNNAPSQQHGFASSYSSHPSYPSSQHLSNNSASEPNSAVQQKTLGGPLTPSSSLLASHNATMTHQSDGAEKEEGEVKKSEGEEKKKEAEKEKKSESATAEENSAEEKGSEGAKKSEEIKKPEGEKKPEDEKKSEGEKKPEEEKKSESEKKPEDEKKPGTEKKPDEEKKSEGEKKPEEDKKSDSEKKPEEEKKPEDDHTNGSFSQRDTIVMPFLSLIGASVGALFIL